MKEIYISQHKILQARKCHTEIFGEPTILYDHPKEGHITRIWINGDRETVHVAYSGKYCVPISSWKLNDTPV